MLILLHFFVAAAFTSFLPRCSTVTYSDRSDFDANGVRIASNDHFVVLAENDANRLVVSLAPFGRNYMCNFPYTNSSDFIISVATGRRQNSTQLSFVCLSTNSTDGDYQTLSLFTFSRTNGTDRPNQPISGCNRLTPSDRSRRVLRVRNRQASEMSNLQVDPTGNYAYGFLSKSIFICDIQNGSVKDVPWESVFGNVTLELRALDVGETIDKVPMAIVAGYEQVDGARAQAKVYLIRLDPPSSMTIVDSRSMTTDSRIFFGGREALTYQFDSVMSVSIHDATQQVLISVPKILQTYLFSFNSTNLTLIDVSSTKTRSTMWLNTNGTRVAYLFSDVATPPWSQSRIVAADLTSKNSLYAYPNNQQTLNAWSNTVPTFIRITATFDHQMVVLTSDGTVVLVRSTAPGYYIRTNDINAAPDTPATCPPGTFKGTRGARPCEVCQAGTKSSLTGKESRSFVARRLCFALRIS